MSLGYWDSHAHVFGEPERYRMVMVRGYTPPVRDIPAFEAIARPHGIDHVVLVQPSVYGTDHSCLIDALEAGHGRHRAVAVLDPTITRPELDRLHAIGVRGVRFNLVSPGGNSLEHFDTLAAKVAPLGWHAQAFAHAVRLPEIDRLLLRTPIPIVLDHFGSLDATITPAQPQWALLMTLMASPHCWVKLSGFYRLSRLGAPYSDMAPLAHALARIAPDRLVWGSDWPHTWFFEPGHGDAPPYGDTLAVIRHAFPDASMQERLLIHNPAKLYT